MTANSTMSTTEEPSVAVDETDTLTFVKEWAQSIGCVCDGGHIDRGWAGIDFVEHDPECPVKQAAIEELEYVCRRASSGAKGFGDIKRMLRLAKKELARLADPAAQPVVDVGPHHFEVAVTDEE